MSDAQAVLFKYILWGLTRAQRCLRHHLAVCLQRQLNIVVCGVQVLGLLADLFSIVLGQWSIITELLCFG